jgi:hypothetical protein
MSIKDIVTERATTAAPSTAYLAAYFTVPSIPTVVSILTGILVCFQLYKAVIEIKIARKKKELLYAPKE